MLNVNQVHVTVYQTYITVKVDKYGNACSHFNLERLLSHLKEYDWDHKTNRYYLKAQYFSFNKETLEVILPRHFLSVLESEIRSRQLELVLIPGKLVIPRHIQIPRNPNWKDKDDIQTQCINFLVNNIEPMCGLTNQPGKGKTYCSITASIKKEAPVLIIVEGLVEQWLTALFEQTLLTPDQVWLIQGHDSIAKMFMLEKHKKPLVFIASLSTIFTYALGVGNNYANIPAYREFLEYFEIGTMILDECHMNFNKLMAILLRSNVFNNWFLSATPRRSDKRADRIYKLIFPEHIFFGKQFYHKYIRIIAVKYAIPINNLRKVRNPKGYSQIKYEQYLLANPMYRNKFFNDVVFPNVQNEYYVERLPGEKLLVLVATTDMAATLAAFLQMKYADLKVLTLVHKDPQSNKDVADIIVSTHKSSGTGTDIANLLTVVDTCSFRASCTLTEQAPGRLRVLPNRTVRYVTLYNQYISDHLRHYEERKVVYHEIAGEFIERSM